MIFAIILLALSVSIDSLGIGITYGIRNTSLYLSAKFILFIVSFIFACLSIFIGNFLFSVLPDNLIKFISMLILVFMGIWIIYEAMNSNKKTKITSKQNISTNFCNKPKDKKVHRIFLKPLGITIQIIKDPISSDFNNSNIIEKNEAFYLAIALSIDSICVGISSSSFGIYSLLFPILVPIFQFLFLNLGILFGKKIVLSSHIPVKIWNIISGILLITIGIIRIWT